MGYKVGDQVELLRDSSYFRNVIYFKHPFRPHELLICSADIKKVGHNYKSGDKVVLTIDITISGVSSSTVFPKGTVCEIAHDHEENYATLLFTLNDLPNFYTTISKNCIAPLNENDKAGGTIICICDLTTLMATGCQCGGK